MANDACDNNNSLANNTATIKKPQRNSVFELLRIISMLLILAFHTFRNIEGRELSTFNLTFYYLSSSWGILGVDLFIITSAWFLSEQKFRAKKLFSLIFEVFTYVLAFSFLYLFWNTYKNGNFTHYLKEIISHHLRALYSPIWGDEYWFITSYIFMLILSPFMNQLYELMGKRRFKILLILLLFVPIYLNFNGQIIIADTANFLYIYLLILYLKKTGFEIKKKWKRILPCAIIFIILLIVSLKVLFVTHLNKIENIKNPGIRFICARIYVFLSKTILNAGRNSAIMLLLALAIFFLVKNIKPFYSKFINLLSSCTLSVYLFHESSIFNLLYFFYNKAASIGFIKNNYLFPLTHTSLLLGIYIISIVVESIRFQLIQKPFNKLLTKKVDKFKKMDDFINFNITE